jgi:hypothetical protein
MKDNFKFIGCFALRTLVITLIAFCCYAVVLHIVGGGSLAYYRGILIVSIIFALSIITLLVVKNNFPGNFPALCLAVILVYSFHVTVPVILDRSISIQIIGSLKNKPANIDDLNKSFLKGYVDGYSTTCRRLNEQVATGNVVIENGVAKLTKKGLMMQRIFNGLAEFLKVEDHYIKGDLDTNYLHHYELENDQCVNTH